MQNSNLYGLAKLGIEFEELKRNPAFQVLLEALQREADEAREQMTETDPEDVEKMRELQTANRMFKALIRTIDAFIQEGHAAQAELERETYE